MNQYNLKLLIFILLLRGYKSMLEKSSEQSLLCQAIFNALSPVIVSPPPFFIF